MYREKEARKKEVCKSKCYEGCGPYSVNSKWITEKTQKSTLSRIVIVSQPYSEPLRDDPFLDNIVVMLLAYAIFVFAGYLWLISSCRKGPSMVFLSSNSLPTLFFSSLWFAPWSRYPLLLFMLLCFIWLASVCDVFSSYFSYLYFSSLLLKFLLFPKIK